MKCVLGTYNLKVFCKAVLCFSRIGEEIHLQLTDKGLLLRTTNSARSAFGSFVFHPSFFKEIVASSSSDDTWSCKINAKAALLVFKPSIVSERSIDECFIDMEDDKLVFGLTFNYGVAKTYRLGIMDPDILEAVYDKASLCNTIIIPVRLLCEAVNNFNANQEEISMTIGPSKVCLKTYLQEQPEPNKWLRTQISFDAQEFDSYHVVREADLTFCLKELRAVLYFAEFAMLPVTCYSEIGGKPIVFALEADDSFTGDFVLATLLEPSPQASPVSQPHMFSQPIQPLSAASRNPPQVANIPPPPDDGRSGGENVTSDTAAVAAEQPKKAKRAPASSAANDVRAMFLGISSQSSSERSQPRPPAQLREGRILVEDSDSD